MPSRTAFLLSLFLLGALQACGSATRAQGRGLELLPDEDPLPAGVSARDPRPNFHDFGRVPDGDVVRHVFRFRNTDPKELAIKRVIPGCGCTVAALRTVRADGTLVPGEPISSKAAKLLVVAPGALAELEVKMSTAEMQTKNADKLVTLAVATDSPNGYYFNLEVHIWVDKPFTVVPGALVLDRVPMNGGGEKQVEIVCSGPVRQALKELRALPSGIHADLLEELRHDIPVWVLRVRLEPPLELGLRKETLRIATEERPGVPGRDLEVPLTAQVVPDLASDPERMVFAAPADQPQTASAELFSLLGGQRLRVTAVELPEAARALFDVHFEPLDADDGGASARWKIALTTRPPLQADAILSGKLLVRIDDPQHPSFELEYVVHVK